MKTETTKKNHRSWNWRSLVSFYLLFASIALLISGLALFVSPPGRFAHSTDWRLLGCNKEQWEAIHTLFGYIGVLFGLFHLILNWKALRNYLRDRARHVYRLKAELIVALLLTVIVWTGSALHLPPFGTVMDWGEGIKELWEQNTPLLLQAPVEEPEREESDTTVSIDATVEEDHEARESGGWGRFTVEEWCAQQDVLVADGLERLAAYDMEASPTTRIRALSDSYGYVPSDIANIILGLEPGEHEAED